MKKILFSLGVLGIIFTGCTSSNENLKEITIVENGPQYVLEDVEKEKKPLEDIIVFNEQGVVIRKENGNLILSMPEEILFDFDSYSVKNSVKDSLDGLAKALIENGDIKLKIDGHTDFIGSDQYNFALSLKRANSIKSYLVTKGVISNNISVEGYGKQNPVASNKTEKGRAKNRRVEFIISRDEVVF